MLIIIIALFAINRIIYQLTLFLQRKTPKEIIELCFYCFYGGVAGGLLGVIIGMIIGLLIYIFVSSKIGLVVSIFIFWLIGTIGGAILAGTKSLD